MTNYNGPERRSTDIKIAVLEAQFIELKESQASIHKRIGETASVSKEDMRIGFEDLRKLIKEYSTCFTIQESICFNNFNKRLTALERFANILAGAYGVIVLAWAYVVKKGN